MGKIASTKVACGYWDEVMNWNSKVKWLHKHGMQSQLFKRTFAELPDMAKIALVKECHDVLDQPENDA